MRVDEIVTMLEGSSLEVAYYQFPEGEAPALPYIVYYFPNADDFQADGINYAGINTLNIELYTENKDFDTEKSIDNILTTNGIPYSKRESYISSEHMYEVLYQTEVIING